MKVERTIDIAAPVEKVYDTVMDPEMLDDWVTIHAGLEDAPNGDLERGSELTQLLKLAGRKVHVRWKVVEAERPTRVVWEGRGPVRTQSRAVYDFKPNGDGTSFSYRNEWSMPGGPIGRVVGRGFEGTSGREAERSLDRLKALLER